MPFYEEFKINARDIAVGEINLSNKMPPIPKRAADISVYIEGRLLSHEIQWKMTGPRELACLPIQPNQQWHVKIWVDKPYEGVSHDVPDHMTNEVVKDAFASTNNPQGYGRRGGQTGGYR